MRLTPVFCCRYQYYLHARFLKINKNLRIRGTDISTYISDYTNQFEIVAIFPATSATNRENLETSNFCCETTRFTGNYRRASPSSSLA